MANQEPPQISRRELFNRVADKLKGIAETGADLSKGAIGRASRMTRRDFLKLSAAGIATWLMKDYFDWTSSPADGIKKARLDFRALESDVFPVNITEELRDDCHADQLGQRNLSADDLLSANKELTEAIKRVHALRNAAIFHPDKAAQAMELLDQYNVDPFQEIDPLELNNANDWNNQFMQVNFKNVLKLEAFFAYRNLLQRGVAPAEKMEQFKFKGQVWYRYSPKIPLQEAIRLEGLNGFASSSIQSIDFGHKYNPKTLKDTDDLVQQYWPQFKKAGKHFNIDPLYLAAVVSMETRDLKEYFLYTENPDTKPYATPLLANGIKYGSLEAGRPPGFLENKVIEIAWFIQEHRDIARHILPEKIPEYFIDLAGGLAGKNTSLGLGQVNIDTARRFGLVDIFGRQTNDQAPRQLMATLLNNPEISIFASAAYFRRLIDEYARMQKAGLNLYLPDLTRYNPSPECVDNKLINDPIYYSNFGRTFFGSLYTALPYPEYPQDGELNFKLRRIPMMFWGSDIDTYYQYYKKERERLMLN